MSIRYFDSRRTPIIELIKIRYHLFSITGDTVYFYKDQKYQLDLKFSKQHSSVISGAWKSRNDPNNYGVFAWNFDIEKNTSIGFWSATRKNGKIEFGRWKLVKLDKNVEKLFMSRFNKKIIKNHKYYSDICDNIIKKHDREPEKQFSFNNKNYDIMENVFNPQFGKVGRPLIEYVLKNYNLSEYKNVLDWGTGCGYYGIEIALKQHEMGVKSQIIALEMDEHAIQCAKRNIVKFLNEDKINLVRGNRISNNNFNVKFDLIIANMPFTKPLYLVNHKKHPMYNCFCSPPELVLEICFEIKNALSSNGIALLTYADSGDGDLLFACLDILNMTPRELFRVDKEHGATDDIFYVYEIRNKKSPAKDRPATPLQ